MNKNVLKQFYIFPEAEDLNKESFVFKAMMSFFLVLVLLVPLDLLVGIIVVRGFFTRMIRIKSPEFIAEKESIEAGEIMSIDVKNVEIFEDFLDIKHIFCDKTGTLTKNQLLFRAFSVDGAVFEKAECFEKDI